MNNNELNYIRFWGVRGSYPAPFGSHLRVGGNTSCVELRVDNHILICDGGTGIIPLGKALMEQQDIKEITIILTHYHLDHISGLPFFIPAFVPGWKINIYGPGNQQEIKQRVFGQMLDPYFPIEAEKWLADIDYLNNDRLEYGPFKIEPFYVHHPGTTYGYRIQVHDKIIIYASDNELSFIEKPLNEDEFEFDELQLIKTMQAEERDKYLKFFDNADVFIHDTQYTPEDYAKKRGWGHSCYIETTNFAMDANVKQLYLFHVDPNYDDTKIEELHRHMVKLIHERQSNMACHIAREGLVIDIDA
jgi:phosphoribosyl 1,2-cyclic phosphodiesterase